MRTEELIQALATDAQPVRRLRPVAARVVGWAVLATVSLIVVMMIMGVRRDLDDALDHADFAFELALLIVTAMSAAVGALVVSIPGAEQRALVRWAPIVGALACVVWAAGELAMAFASGAPIGRLTFAWHCVYKTASVAAVPGVALFLMVRHAAPLRAAWAGLLAVLATAAVGVLGANTICPNDRPLHMLLWHVAPLMLFAALGAALGSWLLRSTPRRR
ncbi:MAG: DUF1109 domain-containing protein [Acidobacteria bacterium]|nr:DUF1109 domain-containing protein [Acidobacteriota bacterium]